MGDLDKEKLLKYLLPGLAGLGILLALVMVIIGLRPAPVPHILFPPPTPPYEHFIAAEGLLEATSENIHIGSPYTEIVEKIYVKPSDRVRKGDPLFKLNTTTVQARLEEAQQALAVAQARYQKELDLPRPEDIPIQKAIMMQAQSSYQGKAAEFTLLEKILNPRAISKNEFLQKQYFSMEAKYKLEEAEKKYDLFLAGAWIRDIEIFRSQRREAEAKVAVIEAELTRSIIRAPADGSVLQINLHEGEIASTTRELKEPLMVFGAEGPLIIFINIDEEEVWRFIEGAPGIAYFRGNSTISVPLKYLYTIPLMVPKSSLTGRDTERTDTRILQVAYELETNEPLPLFPGLLMDVYLESKSYKTQPSRKKA